MRGESSINLWGDLIGVGNLYKSTRALMHFVSSLGGGLELPLVITCTSRR